MTRMDEARASPTMRIIAGYGTEARIAGMHASIPRNKRMVQERGR